MTRIEFLAASLPYKPSVMISKSKETYKYRGAWFDDDISGDYLFDIKPVVRHIETINKECVQADYNGGKPFIPIVELLKPEIDLEGSNLKWIGTCLFSELLDIPILSLDRLVLKLEQFQQLLKWHFWPCMPEGEEVIYVTNEFNPYI